MRKAVWVYLVEGEDEKKLVRTLITDMGLILPGKVRVLNVVQEKITRTQAVSFGELANIILVFDTDCDNSAILNSNIKLLKSLSNVQNVYCIPQVRNLEDELLRSCKIRTIRELTSSKSNTDYKKDLIRMTNLASHLKTSGFDIKIFWNRVPSGTFSGIPNDASKIRRTQ